MINWIKKKIEARKPENRIWYWLECNPEHTIIFTDYTLELRDTDGYSTKEYLVKRPDGLYMHGWDNTIVKRLDHMKRELQRKKLN